MALRMLIVDDEPEICDFLRDIATGIGYEGVTTNHAEDFKRAFAEKPADVILLDLTLPGADGIELLKYMAEMGTRARILIVSGFDEGIRRMAHTIGKAKGLALRLPGAEDRAMRVHHAFRASGRAGRVEPERRSLGRTAMCLGAARAFVDRADAGGGDAQVAREARLGDEQPGRAVFGDVAQVRVAKLGVEPDRHRATPDGAEPRDRVAWRIAEQDQDAIARRHAESRIGLGRTAHAPGERCIAHDLRAEDECRAIAEARQRFGSQQAFYGVHGRPG